MLNMQKSVIDSLVWGCIVYLAIHRIPYISRFLDFGISKRLLWAEVMVFILSVSTLYGTFSLVQIREFIIFILD